MVVGTLFQSLQSLEGVIHEQSETLTAKAAEIEQLKAQLAAVSQRVADVKELEDKVRALSRLSTYGKLPNSRFFSVNETGIIP